MWNLSVAFAKCCLRAKCDVDMLRFLLLCRQFLSLCHSVVGCFLVGSAKTEVVMLQIFHKTFYLLGVIRCLELQEQMANVYGREGKRRFSV
jgi:hypothetical protein